MKEKIKKFLPNWLRHIYWLTQVLRVKIITWTPRYDEDELMTSHKCDFMKDQHFIRCYDLAVNLGLAVSNQIHWRAHVVCWAADRARLLDGDFVECGVNKGFLSRTVMEYINFKSLPKTFYLMDTFEGFSDKYLTAQDIEAGKSSDSYEPCYELVKKTFGEFHNVAIIKGPIPDTLPEVKTAKVAYLHIDMNCMLPEIAAAEYFWDRLISGAIVILDDYGHAGHEEQMNAFDDFASAKGVKILSLPTGQGLIIKS
jgi:hypothetical protein